MLDIVRSLAFFLLAGIFEIGGGYLVWLAVREEKPWWIGAIGILIMGLYAVVATFQPQNFGRVYASYGGVFIILSLIWSWKIDGQKPDNYDWSGIVLIFVGVLIMFFAPRK